MDEGIKNAELIFRATLATKEALLKWSIAILKAIIKHMEWLKQQNIKPFWKEKADKIQIKATRNICTMVEKQRNNFKDIVSLHEKELDKFKLDKQYELENYKVEINKAQKALDLSKEEKNTEAVIENQKLLNQALENKREFEYKTNKEILNKNHTLDEYKKKLAESEYDLTICNSKLNALESSKKIETGRLRREYQDLTNRYLNNDTELNPIKSIEVSNDYINPIETEKINNDINQKMAKNIDNIKEIYEDIKVSIDENDPKINYENDEYYDKLENKMDKLLETYEDTELQSELLKEGNDVTLSKDDVVNRMLSKDGDALKAYDNSKSKGEFKVNSITKNIDTAIER